jgi:hypothetical protein
MGNRQWVFRLRIWDLGFLYGFRVAGFVLTKILFRLLNSVCCLLSSDLC